MSNYKHFFTLVLMVTQTFLLVGMGGFGEQPQEEGVNVFSGGSLGGFGSQPGGGPTVYNQVTPATPVAPAAPVVNPSTTTNQSTITIPDTPVIGPDTTGSALFSAFLTDLQSYQSLLQNFCSTLQQYQNGNYYFMAFESTGMPYLIIETCKAFSLRYIQGRLKQLSGTFYATGTADNFINFSPQAIAAATQTNQNFSGELAQLDQFMQTLKSTYDTQFSQLTVSNKMNSWKQQQQQNYEKVFTQYQQVRNQAVVNWFVMLVQQLAVMFNEKNIELKNFSYEFIPNMQALDRYYVVFQEALQNLVTADQPCTAGKYSFNPNGVVTQITFTTSSDFQTAVTQNVAQNLADISTYVGQFSLWCAGQIAQGYQVPEPQKTANPMYNQGQGLLESDATFDTYNGTVSTTPVALSAINILQQPGFTQFTPQFQILNNQVEGLLGQCAFDMGIIPLTNITGTNGFATLPTVNQSVSSLAQIQKNNFTQFTAAQKKGNHNSSGAQASDAERILAYLAQADAAFTIAKNTHTQADQSVEDSFFAMRKKQLDQIIDYFDQAVTYFEKAQSAPLFEPATSSTITQGTYYYDAFQAFSQAADQFTLMGTSSGQALAMYTKKLAAQLGIEQFVSLIHGYVNDAQLVADYANSVAVDEPKQFYSAQVAGNAVDQYQTELNQYITLFGPLLSDAVQRYQDELAFYISLNDPDNADNQMEIENLQIALQLLINLNTGFENLYKKTKNTNPNGQFISGANYIMNQILSATGDAEIITLFQQANQEYNKALQAFEKVDALFENNKSALQAYAPLLELATFFTVQDVTKQGTFRLFLLAHQARLYMTIGQKLLFEQKNPLAYLFFIWSAGLYQQAGLYHEDQFQAVITWNDSAVPANDYFTLQIETLIPEFQKELSGKESSMVLLEKLYEKIVLLMLVEYLHNGNTQTISAHLSVLQQYQNWLLKQEDTTTQFFTLKAACVGYKLYLFGLAAGISDAYKKYYVPAAQFMPDLTNTINRLYQDVQGTFGKQLSKAAFKQKVATFTTLLNLETQSNYEQQQMTLWRMLFNQSEAKDLTLPSVPKNLHKQLGDLYQEAADTQLALQQTYFASGKNYNSSNYAMTNLIIEWYSLAAIEYAIAQDQKNYMQTSIGKTNAIAFQTYSNIIPVYHFSLPGISIDNPGQIPFSTCQNTTSMQTAMQSYSSDTPLYVARYQEQIIPSNYTLSDGAQAIAIQLYSDALTQQSGGAIDVTQYVAEYTNQVKTMLSSGVKSCGQTIIGSLKIETVADGVVLKMYNMPLVPLPRFQGETGTVLQLLSQGPLKLYGSGVAPINYAGQLLQPAHNSKGQYLTKLAILNTYLAAAVYQGAKVDQVTKSTDFNALQTLTEQEKITASFGDYATMYQAINSSTVTLLAIYQALSNYIEAFGQGQDFMNSLQAQQYLDWAKNTAEFLVGNPTDMHYKSLLKSIYNYATAVLQYDQTPLTLATQAFGVFGNVVLRASQELCATSAQPQTTEYPEKSTVYPKPVPEFNFYDWKNALEYAVLGQKQLSNFIDTYQIAKNKTMHYSATTVYPLKMILQNLYLQMAQSTFYSGIYYLAHFGYNAYQELTCPLTKVAKKSSITDIIGLTNAPDAKKYWQVQEVTTGTPGYPENLYPADGYYPQTGITIDKYGNHINVPLKKGKTFQLLQTTQASNVFQGVASIEQAQFQTILNSGQVGQDEQSFNSWISGSGAGINNQSLSSAYTLMNNYCLQAISNLSQVGNYLGALKDLFGVRVQASKKVTPAQLLTTLEIAKIFSTGGAFQPDFPSSINEMTVPTIVVSTASQSEGSQQTVSRFTQIKNYTNINYHDASGSWAPLSLASSSDIYDQTLRYWVSQNNPDFWQTVLKPSFTWVDTYGQALLEGTKINKKSNQSFDIEISWAQLVSQTLGAALNTKPTKMYYNTAYYNFINTIIVWSDQLNQLARYLYMFTYLPQYLTDSQGYANATEIINQQLQLQSNTTFITANQYVG